MESVIHCLQIQLAMCEQNAPIQRQEGRIDQAEHNEKHAAELRDALALLMEAQSKPEVPMTPEVACQIRDSKQFRKDLDAVLSHLRQASSPQFKPFAEGGLAYPPGYRSSRERATAITKIQEAIMWLGMDLKAINEENPGASPNPYPQSYNPASAAIEPTADGLKL